MNKFPVSLTMRDLVLIAFRYRFRLLAVFGFCLLVSILLALFTTRIYQSDASILIKLGREFVYRPEIGSETSQIIPTQGDSEEILNTQVQLLRSRDVVVATIERVGLQRLYPKLVPGRDLDEAIARFLIAFNATPLRTSNIIQLSFRHPDPAIAEETLADLMQVFRDKSLDIYAGSKTAFFEQQVDLALARYREAGNKLAEFRAKYGPLAYEADVPLLLQQRTDLASLSLKTESDLAAARDRVASLKARIDATPSDVVAFTDTEQSRVLDDARTKLLNLQLRKEELQSQFSDDSRQMAQVKKEITIADDFLRRQSQQFAGTVRHARNETLISVEQDLAHSEADVAALSGRAHSLQDQLAALDTQIASVSAHETERWTLERTVQSEQDVVKQFTEKLGQARASDFLNQDRIGDIGIVQAPSRPAANQPVRPKAALNILVGLIAGLLGSVIVALLSELTSDTIYDPTRTEKLLDLPVLAVFNMGSV